MEIGAEYLKSAQVITPIPKVHKKLKKQYAPTYISKHEISGNGAGKEAGMT